MDKAVNKQQYARRDPEISQLFPRMRCFEGVVSRPPGAKLSTPYIGRAGFSKWLLQC